MFGAVLGLFRVLLSVRFGFRVPEKGAVQSGGFFFWAIDW